jgi:hypothetical protein
LVHPPQQEPEDEREHEEEGEQLQDPRVVRGLLRVLALAPPPASSPGVGGSPGTVGRRGLGLVVLAVLVGVVRRDRPVFRGEGRRIGTDPLVPRLGRLGNGRRQLDAELVEFAGFRPGGEAGAPDERRLGRVLGEQRLHQAAPVERALTPALRDVEPVLVLVGPVGHRGKFGARLTERARVSSLESW